MLTTLHYADNLKTPRNNAFRLAYAKAYDSKADVYAVQGYDSAQLLGIGRNALRGRMRRLGIERPTHEPRATEYIPQMLSMISTLEQKG